MTESVVAAFEPPVTGAVIAVRPPLTARQQGTYALGDILDGAVITAMNTVVLFYLTAVCGLSGTQAGAALFLAMSVDAIADPVIGFSTDNARFRMGRRHPFMFAAVAPLTLAFGLLFSTPAALTGWGLFAWAATGLLAVRVCHSAFTLPYAALGAELTNDYAERSVFTTYRWFFNILGQLACIVLGLGVFLHGEGLRHRENYLAFGWSVAAIALVAGLLAGIGTLPLRSRLQAPLAGKAPSLLRLPLEMADVFRNRSFRVLFATAIVFFTAQGAVATLGLHANKYFWALPAPVIFAIPLATLAGLVAGVPISALVARRFEKSHVSAAGIGVVAVLQFVPPLLRLGHVLPDAGPVLNVFLCGVAVLTGASLTTITISFWSMMADAADEHEYLFGSRREALYFAGLTLSAKAASGVGAFAAGVALDLIGFPKDIAAIAHPVIAEGTLRALGLFYGPGGAIGAAASALILTRYSLGRDAQARMQQVLADRRAAGAALTSPAAGESVRR